MVKFSGVLFSISSKVLDFVLPKYPEMREVFFILKFHTAEFDLSGIDDDHKITAIHIGRVARLMLASAIVSRPP